MNIIYKDGYGIANGIKFRKDKKTGYYLSGVINGKRKRLHRYVWEQINGEIPKGYDIHHIDHNKDNNDISNLELLASIRHKQVHGMELTKEQRNEYTKILEEKARPKAIEWHKSKEGIKWHKEQYKISLGNIKPQQFTCMNCGKVFDAYSNGKNKYCSEKCCSAYRRKSGIDNEKRKCIICGSEFECNRYSKKQKCDNCIPQKYKKNRKS